MTVRHVDLIFGMGAMETDETAPQLRRGFFDLLGNAPFRKRLLCGSGGGQVDQIYGRAISLAASAAADRDLIGSLTDNFAATLNFRTVLAIALVNTTVNATGIISFGPKSSASATAFYGTAADRALIYPALAVDNPGLLVHYAPRGIAQTAGADTYTITNTDGANAVTGYLMILGRSL